MVTEVTPVHQKYDSNHTLSTPCTYTSTLLRTYALWVKYIVTIRGCKTIKCKNQYLVLALGEEIAVQAVVDTIISATLSQAQKAEESGEERPRLCAS